MEPQHESDLVERARNWESKETFRLQELPSRTSRSTPVAAPLKRLSSPFWARLWAGTRPYARGRLSTG